MEGGEEGDCPHLQEFMYSPTHGVNVWWRGPLTYGSHGAPVVSVVLICGGDSCMTPIKFLYDFHMAYI